MVESESDGGDGSSTFTGLTDTPEDYDGHANKIVTVNETEDGLEFSNPSQGSGGNGNIYQIPENTEYEVVEGQELINTGLMYLDGQMNLNGKWVMMGEGVTSNLEEVGFGVGDDDDHTHSDLIILATLSMNQDQISYYQDVYHTLGSFPLLKILDDTGFEIDPLIKHLSTNHFRIRSKIALYGKVYALHSVQTRTPVLFGPLNLALVAGHYVQIIEHNTESFPFFKIMDGHGQEMELSVRHLSNKRAEIKSNILVAGNIYML